MGWLNIRIYPDPVLKKISDEVENIDKNVLELSKNMIDTMFYSSCGVGLAAPQIGINTRLAVIDKSLGKKSSPIIVINPKIISQEDEVVADEGCLSFPDLSGPVKRARRIEIEFYNEKENLIRLIAEDFLARVFQHEIDHLDGILFLDRMSHLRRNFLKNRYLKRMKKQGR